MRFNINIMTDSVNLIRVGSNFNGTWIKKFWLADLVLAQTVNSAGNAT